MARKRALAKFTIPRQHGVAERRRLIDRLLEPSASPAAWVQGAPGAGKSTLAANFVASQGTPFVWFRVEPPDNDLADFFGSLTAACRNVVGRSTRLPTFGAEHVARAASFARRYYRALYAQLPAACKLVFDDVHELEDGAPLEVLRIAVEEAPDDVQLLLLSRTAPPMALAAMEAAGRLAVLDERLLDFTSDELTTLLPDHAADAVAAVHALTGGWSAGIALAARHWARDATRPDGWDRDAQEASKDAIFRFFAYDVLRKMSVHERLVLQTAALLPEMRAADVEALTGSTDAGRILESAYRRNLFTSYRRGTPGTYQFHALFREFLQNEARVDMAPGAFADRRLQAARLLVANGDVASALPLLVDLQAWTIAAETIVGFAPAVLRQGRHATLRRWIDALPSAVVDADPWLSYWMGQACGATDDVTAYWWYARAFVRFGDGLEGALGRALSASAAVVLISVSQVTFLHLPAWSRRLGESLVALPERLSHAHRVSVSTAVVVARAMGMPVLPDEETLATVERLLTLTEADPASVDAHFVAGGCLIIGYAASERAESIFERMRRLVEPRLHDDGILPAVRSGWLLQAANCFVAFSLKVGSMRSVEPARRALEEARAIIEREELHLLEFNLLSLEARFAMVAGDEARYIDRAERMRDAVTLSRPYLFCGRCIELCNVHLARGEYAEALRMVEEGKEAAALAAATSIYQLELFQSHACALIGLDRGADVAAIGSPALEGLQGRMRRVKQAFERFARAWQVRDDPDRYPDLLQAAFDAAVEAQFFYFFWQMPSIAARLCLDAIERTLHGAFARACARRRRLAAPDNAGEHWPWQVRIRVLGPFALHCHDGPVAFDGKAPRRQVLLLQAIVAAGPGGLETWRAISWLWSKGDAGKNALDVTLYRLRKLLGENDAIAIRDGKLVLDRSLVWTDLTEAEALSNHLLAQNLTQWTDAALEGQATRLLALHRGPLLPDVEDGDWLAVARERVRARFERVIRALGGELEWRSSWRLALDLYARSLEIDPVAEEAYRGQIRCHLALRQSSEAMQAFRRCRQMLSIVLGIAPSPHTVALMGPLVDDATWKSPGPSLSLSLERDRP